MSRDETTRSKVIRLPRPTTRREPRTDALEHAFHLIIQLGMDLNAAYARIEALEKAAGICPLARRKTEEANDG